MVFLPTVCDLIPKLVQTFRTCLLIQGKTNSTRARACCPTQNITVLYCTVLHCLKHSWFDPKHNWAELQQSLLEVQRCRLTGQRSVLYGTALRHVCAVQCTGNSGAVMCCCGSCSTILLQYSTVLYGRPDVRKHMLTAVRLSISATQMYKRKHYCTVLHAAARA